MCKAQHENFILREYCQTPANSNQNTAGFIDHNGPLRLKVDHIDQYIYFALCI